MKRKIAAVCLLAIMAVGAFYGLGNISAGTINEKKPVQVHKPKKVRLQKAASIPVEEDSIQPMKDFPEKYCARMKGAMVVVVHEGKEIIEDVKLANGMTIKADGSVIQEDGTLFTLRAGECIDKAGNITPEEPLKPKKTE